MYMHLRVVLALSCGGLALALNLRGAAAGTPDAQHSATTYVLALRLAQGERIVEHADIVDRVTWVLPAAKLESFRAQGFIVNEEARTHVLAGGTVISASATSAAIKSEVTTTTYDVPRKHTSVSRDRGVSLITPANAQIGATRYAIEDAPMIDLPRSPVGLGSRWTTRQLIVTTLGSGTAVFEHVVSAVDGARVRVDVTGSGTITGKEYNLPRLLPGTISLSGSSWFDTATGLVVQESYHVDNVLVKPAGTERIGFTESLDADSDVHKEEPGKPRN